MSTTWVEGDPEAADPERAGAADGREPARGAPAAPSADRYRGAERIGEGGMGEVDGVHDTVLRRDVAIKRLRASGTAARDRFVAEAQVTAQLDHPNVVPVHDLGVDAEGRPFMVMKRVRGRALTALIASDPAPSLEQKLDIFRKICDAMAYAHAHGVLHRDLKPDNVMVGAFGEVLVMDWGLARPWAAGGRAPADEAPTGDASTRLRVDRFDGSALRTRHGQVAGTPAFMAPEQAAGHLDVLDVRTDVYGLGAVLYTLLVGRPPFEGPTEEVLDAVREGRAAPLRAGVPRELGAVVRTAMALRPDDRYPSVDALREDVEAFRAYRPLVHVRSTPTERLAKWARRHRGAVRGGLAVAVVAGTLLLAGLGRYAADVGEARDRAVEEAQRALGAERAAREQLVAARVALSDSRSEQGDITGAGVALREAVSLAEGLDMDRRGLEWARSAHAARRPPPVASCDVHGGASVVTLAVSSDGSEVTSLGADGVLLTWTVEGCAVRARSALGRVQRAALAYGDGGARGLVTRDGPRGAAGELVPVWDGRALPPTTIPTAARVSRVRVDDAHGDAAGGDGGTFRVDLRSGRVTPRLSGPSAGAVWWRKGDARLGVSEPTGQELGGAWRDDGRSFSGAGVTDVDVSSDGGLAVVASAFGHALVDLATGRNVWEHRDGATHAVRVSDDDERLIATRFDGSAHVDRLSDGAPLTQVEGNADGNLGVVGSSSDARVVAVTRPGGRVDVHVVPLRAPLRLPLRFGSTAHAAAVSRDGRLLAVGSDDGTLRILDAASGATLRVAEGFDGGVRHARFSPDGRSLLLGLRAGAIGLLDLATGDIRRWELGGRAPAVDWIDADTVGAMSTLGVAWRLQPERNILVELGAVSGSSTWDGVAVPGTGWLAVDGLTQASSATTVVVDVRDGRVVSRREHAGSRYRIAAAPDGRALVSGTGTGALEIWDPATGAVLHTLQADAGPTMGVAFSPDGGILASTGFDGALDLWDTRSWTLLRSVPLHDGPGTAVAFTPDGRGVLTTGGLGAVLFPLDVHLRHAAAVQALSGPLAERPAALAALGWWERVGAALDAAVAAGAPDDAALRTQAARALAEAHRDGQP